MTDSTIITKIKNSFKAEFHEMPEMIFSPGRINLIGEHIDYNDGLVFPAAIDKGIVLAIQKSSNDTSVIISNDFEETFDYNLKQTQPLENGGWRNYFIGVISEIKKLGRTIEPFNIIFSGSIPSGAGLSSSAALENAIVFGFNHLFNLGLAKKEMIFISQKAEHDYVGVKCGIMDQYASMFGKENHFLMLNTRSLESEEFHIDLSNYALTLINTNVQHNLSESTYNERRDVCEKVSRMLGKAALRDVSLKELDSLQDQISKKDYQRILYVVEEIERTQKAKHAIQQNDILTLGKLLYQTHLGLSSQYEVSCPELDFLVNKAKESKCVVGARMMGGGFGGCTLNIIKKEDVNTFLEETKKAYIEKFGYECSGIKVKLSQGTHLITE